MPALPVAFRLVVDSAAEDDAICALWELGTTGVHTFATRGNDVELHAWFVEAAGLLQKVRAALPAATVEPTEIADVDWVARFRESFRPMDAAGFRIVPTWMAQGPQDGVLIVDPGRAFGTGTHETTRLCLEALADLKAGGMPERVLDYGTGTGLLAVAAARLGARLVVAVDNDPEATDAACTHGALNAATVHVVLGDGGRALRPGAFDLVLANVTAPLLRERRDEILGLLAPGGRLVLAGLLVEDADALRTLYETAGPVDGRTDGEWASLRVGPCA